MSNIIRTVNVEAASAGGDSAPQLATRLQGERAIVPHLRRSVRVDRVDSGVENDVGGGGVGLVGHDGFLFKQSTRNGS